MAVRQDRGRWAVEFQQRGVRVFKRLPPGTTKAQAQEWETRQRRAIFDRDELGHKEDLTLAGAIGLWLANNRRKNQKQAVSEAKQWEKFVAGKLLRDTPEVAQEAVTAWSRPGIVGHTSGKNALTKNDASRKAAATINRRLCVLKAAAKLAWKHGLIADNISGRITLLPERNAREIYLTKAQVRSIGSATTGSMRSAIWLAAYTGLRASELLAITRVTGAASLTVPQSKTGKPRVVPVPLPARRYLSALPLGLSYWQLHKEFDRAKRKAGMRHVRFHDLRHTCASWLANAGVDQFVVGRILGHTSPQSTARYSHLFDKTLKRAMGKLK